MDGKVNTCSICKTEFVEKLLGETLKYCQGCFEKNKTYRSDYSQKIISNLSSINQIDEKIFLGNYYGALNKLELELYGITHILNCALGLPNPHPDFFKYENLDMIDVEEENLLHYLERALKFIDRADKVYIHCHAGISRSASIVIGYFMYKNKISYEESYNIVKKKRNKIYPNDGFIEQLKNFEY
jgi:protein-tyrosine phosphatase